MSNDQRASVFRWSEVFRNWAVALGPFIFSAAVYFGVNWLESRFVTNTRFDVMSQLVQELSKTVLLINERQQHDAAQDTRMDRFEAQLRELLTRRIMVGEPYSNSK
jgi:hypothetical protein